MSYGVFECSDWLDLTSPVGIRSTSFSYRITPVAWDIDSSLILEPATIMKEAYQVCIQCHPCLIIGYLLLYFGLSDSIYPDFSSFEKFMTLFCRYFLGILSLVIWKPRDMWKYFQEFVIVIVSIAFKNGDGATNCNRNFPFYRFFV